MRIWPWSEIAELKAIIAMQEKIIGEELQRNSQLRHSLFQKDLEADRLRLERVRRGEGVTVL